MKAIQVKYLGPTDHNGARWKVMCDGFKSKTFGRDYSLDHDKDARNCAEEFFKENLRWSQNYELVDGVLPNGDHVFCLVNALN